MFVVSSDGSTSLLTVFSERPSFVRETWMISPVTGVIFHSNMGSSLVFLSSETTVTEPSFRSKLMVTLLKDSDSVV